MIINSAATVAPPPAGQRSDVDILRSAIAALLKDDGFRLTSVPATTTTCLDTASRLMEWMSVTSSLKAEGFTAKLMASLRNCLSSRSRLSKARKAAMWRSFHQVRMSHEFRLRWKEFISSAIGAEAQPLFFQYVTNKVFQTLLQEHFSAESSSEQAEVKARALTYEEGNALRYVAGYVCYKLCKKITSSAHPIKRRLLLCLRDLLQEENEVVSCSAEWVELVDRGGLVHVCENAFRLFEQMELCIRSVFSTQVVHDISNETKKQLHTAITTDEDVAFFWSMLTAEVDDEEGTIVLGMIADLYITIRGFSFTKSLMEMHKQAAKKATQKSKSLRRNLCTADD